MTWNKSTEIGVVWVWKSEKHNVHLRAIRGVECAWTPYVMMMMMVVVVICVCVILGYCCCSGGGGGKVCVCVSLKAMSIVVWSAMGIWENMWNGLTGSYRFWVYLMPEWQESQL